MLLDEAPVWYKVENHKIDQNSDLFELCKVTDITRSGITLTNVATNVQISAGYENVFPASDNLPVDDCCRLKALNMANILKNLKSRYENDYIYTYVANILIAVNPFTKVPKLYSAFKNFSPAPRFVESPKMTKLRWSDQKFSTHCTTHHQPTTINLSDRCNRTFTRSLKTLSLKWFTPIPISRY